MKIKFGLMVRKGNALTKVNIREWIIVKQMGRTISDNQVGFMNDRIRCFETLKVHVYIAVNFND